MTKKNLSKRGVPWRMVAFLAVLIFLIGYPLYTFVDATISGGIWRKGDLLVVDLKAMSNFEMNQSNATASEIPQKFRELDGKRVMMTGEMWAPYNAGGQVSGFQLCYSIAKCCFSGPPKVQHFVKAAVPMNRRVGYHSGLVKVVGTLRVGVEQAGGRVESIYRVEVESVEPV